MDAELLSGTFVDLADTMVADFDIIDFLLAERLSVDMDLAFTMLRDYARNSNQRLTDVARNLYWNSRCEVGGG
jgi:hypothetical protein